MGNFLTRHRSREEKEKMREEIKGLSLLLGTLQNELVQFKNREEETEKQRNNTEKDLIKETNECNKMLQAMQDMFAKTIKRIEGDIDCLGTRSGELSDSFEKEIREILKRVEDQEIKGDDIKKYLQQSKENRVSKREFKAVNAKLENLEEAVMKERSALRPIVLEMMEELSSKWDQQFLDMAKNQQETYSSVMQLVTLDLAHERDILGLKKRISRLEDANAPRLFEEDLPEPSLPRIHRMKPAQSEAGHAKQQSSSTNDVVLEDRKRKCSRIMSELKKMSEEIGRKRST